MFHRIIITRTTKTTTPLLSIRQCFVSYSPKCYSNGSFLSSSSFSTLSRRLTGEDTPSTSTNVRNPVFDRIAIIGAGKMGRALMEPLISQGVQPADKFCVYDVSLQAIEDMKNELGVQIATSLPEAVTDADLVVLAVKPQNLTDGFFAEIRKGSPKSDAIVLSIIAGKPSSEFYHTGMNKIVRSMPNTPAMIGQGMTVWSCSPNLTTNERQKIRDVLGSMGKSMYVDDESFIDMATSISGSGPAYIFMLMESMIDAGVHMGFPREKATTLVYQTMLGSTIYAMESKEHPAILRNNVTSPSGTTASALYELENGRFRTVIKDAMWACYRRSLEMGNHDSNVGPGRFHTVEPRIIVRTENTNTTVVEDHDNSNSAEETIRENNDQRQISKNRIIIQTEKYQNR